MTTADARTLDERDQRDPQSRRLPVQSTSTRRTHGAPCWLRGRRLWCLAAVGVAAVNVAVLGTVQALVPGVDLFPSAATQAPADLEAVGPAEVPVSQPRGALPAQGVLDAVLAVTPDVVRGGGWRESADSSHGLGEAADFRCGAADPSAVLSSSRGWVMTHGPLPSDVSGALTVTARAYGAGQGAAAMASQRALLDACEGVSLSSTSGLGVEGMRVAVGEAQVLVWRRGDVVVSLTQVRGDASRLAESAASFDAALAPALTQVCAAPQSSAADARRSPYVHPEQFTGLTVSHTVDLTVPVDAEQPLADPAPVPLAPAVVVPERPEGALPVDVPQALPAAVARPRVPVAPQAAPRSADVGQRVADEQGPGCGWAFTGQVSPAFDADAAAEHLVVSKEQALTVLRQGWSSWVAAHNAYVRAYEEYSRDASAYNAYATQVRQVAQAWEAVQGERDDYEAALRRYERAVAAREAFLARQAQAQAGYDAAVQECSLTEGSASSPGAEATVSPSLSPSPSSSPAPGGAGGAGRAGSGEASSGQTGSAGAVACPPTRPDILDQQPPTVPELPVAPSGLGQPEGSQTSGSSVGSSAQAGAPGVTQASGAPSRTR